MDTSDIIVRVGTPDDFMNVMILAHLVANENAPVAPNMDKIKQGIWDALNKQGGMVGIVGPRDSSDVHGFVLLRIGPPWYSDERMIEDAGVYVHPDWRSSKHAAPSGADRLAGRSPGRASMLYRFCKRVADETGYKLFIGVVSQRQQEAKLRYYRRFFGEQAGGFFVYDPRAAQRQAAE
jgi:hypothetical protein